MSKKIDFNFRNVSENFRLLCLHSWWNWSFLTYHLLYMRDIYDIYDSVTHSFYFKSPFFILLTIQASIFWDIWGVSRKSIYMIQWMKPLSTKEISYKVQHISVAHLNLLFCLGLTLLKWRLHVIGHRSNIKCNYKHSIRHLLCTYSFMIYIILKHVSLVNLNHFSENGNGILQIFNKQ